MVVVLDKEGGNVLGISFRPPSLTGMMNDAAASPHTPTYICPQLENTSEQSQRYLNALPGFRITGHREFRVPTWQRGW